MALKLHHKRFYPYLFISGAIVLFGARLVTPGTITRELLLSLTGGLAAFIYFLYKQHLDETRLFKELFVEFNKRYDALNDRLNDICRAPETQDLEQHEIHTLFDYFNLCAEEFLFFKSGYIDEEVWQSWRRGMKFFAKNQRIGKLWEKELSSDSYYGFRLD